MFVAAAPLACRTGPPATVPAAAWQPRFALQLSNLRHISKPRDWQTYPYPFLFGQFDPRLFPVQAWRESAGTVSSGDHRGSRRRLKTP